MSYSQTHIIEIEDSKQGVMLHAVMDSEDGLGVISYYVIDNNGDRIKYFRITFEESYIDINYNGEHIESVDFS